MYKNVYLKKGKEESLKRFHPWIFSGAIQRMDNDIEEGETVRVFTSAGDFIAIGHYQIGSIAVRVLSFSDVDIDWCMAREITCRVSLSTAMVLLP